MGDRLPLRRIIIRTMLSNRQSRDELVVTVMFIGPCVIVITEE